MKRSNHGATPMPEIAVSGPSVPGRRAFLAALGATAGTLLAPGRSARAQSAETPADAIARIVAARQIVNAHEHVQGEENTEELLRQMDALGIGRTVLVGSPWFTISLYEQAGFSRYDENNEAILAMARAHPGRFEAWPTANPLDGEKVNKIKSLVEGGARGVKLYLGHGYTSRRQNTYIFHPIAMDAPEMMELYSFLEEAHLPVCYHVNPAKPGFLDEFIAVLRRFPRLKVNTPHFMLSSMAHSRLREMFDCFPNLVADISFGHDDYLKTGLQRVSANAAGFHRLFADYPDRFLFGTDFVVTTMRPHSQEWYATRMQAYLDMLGLARYTTSLVPGYTLNGLALDPALLEGLLFRNFEAFRDRVSRNAAATREVQWSNLRVAPVERAPGQALPPPERRGRWRE